MGFSGEVFRRAGDRAGYSCESCGEDVSKANPDEASSYVVHSATSFHLVGGPGLYLVTDPPIRYAILKNKWLPLKFFATSRIGLPDDAFCLCRTCHNVIHNEALIETKLRNPKYKGRMALPVVLEEVTLKRIYEYMYAP